MRWLLLGFWVIPIHSCFTTCVSFLKDFWVSFRLLLKVLACVYIILLLHVEHIFGSYLTHIHMVFQNAVNWSKLNCLLQQLFRFWFHCFQGQVPTVDWHFHVLLIVDILRFSILRRGHTLLLNLENHSETHVSLFSGLSKPLKLSKSFCSFFARFKPNFDAGTLFCQVCHFVGTPCRTKIHRPDILYVPLRQSHDVQLSS